MKKIVLLIILIFSFLFAKSQTYIFGPASFGNMGSTSIAGSVLTIVNTSTGQAIFKAPSTASGISYSAGTGIGINGSVISASGIQALPTPTGVGIAILGATTLNPTYTGQNLVAGSNVTITGNTISGTAGGGFTPSGNSTDYIKGNGLYSDFNNGVSIVPTTIVGFNQLLTFSQDQICVTTQTGAIIFTLSGTGNIVGKTISIKISGNSVGGLNFTPDFTILGGAFDNTKVNYLYFHYGGANDVRVTISQPGGASGIVGSALAVGRILVGSTSNVSAPVTFSGDVLLDQNGSTTVGGIAAGSVAYRNAGGLLIGNSNFTFSTTAGFFMNTTATGFNSISNSIQTTSISNSGGGAAITGLYINNTLKANSNGDDLRGLIVNNTKITGALSNVTAKYFEVQNSGTSVFSVRNTTINGDEIDMPSIKSYGTTLECLTGSTTFRSNATDWWIIAGGSWSRFNGKSMFGTISISPTGRVHSYESTIGSPVLTLETVAFNNNITRSVYHNKVATSTSTLTTLHTFTTATSVSYRIIAHIHGLCYGGAFGHIGDTGGYYLTTVVKNVAGTVSMVGSQVPTAIDVREDQPAWDAQINISGTNVLFQVLGATLNNISWTIDLTIENISQ